MSYIGTTEIGKIFLGTTEIDKAYLGSSLVFQSGESPAPPAPTSYVTDGLVLWLDGINQGGTSGRWIDLVGGHNFTGSATFNSGYVSFNGTSNYLSNSSFTPPSSNNGTIEVVFKATDSGRSRIIFMPKNVTSAIAFGLVSSDSVVWTLTPKKGLYTNCSGGSVSVNAARGLLNGVAMSTSGEDNWAYANATYSYIGRRNRSGSYCYFKGNVYCIRIYNRQLTQSEMLSNFAFDKTRFDID